MRFMRISLSVLFSSLLLLGGTASAQSNPRDADSNAMIYNGAYTLSELKTKLQNGDSKHSASQLQQEYTSRGVTIESLSDGKIVNGYVTRNGRVLVGDKTVATGARSYGRKNMSDSKRDGNLYVRPTSVSFSQDKLPAFVHMTNGRFDYAIIKSCGNLAVATPVAAKQKTAIKTVPQPLTVNVVQIQTQTQTQTQPAPAPAPAKELPKTGTEALPLLGLTALAGTVWQYRRSRQSLHQAAVSTKI